MIRQVTARQVIGEDSRAAGRVPEGPWRRRLPAASLVLALAALPGHAGAQDAAVFTPTYAASQGSPYSDVYARTFGTTGRPDAAAGQAEPPPLQTAAPPPAAAQEPAPGDVPGLVYVIEGSRLLTYRAADYAGGGTAIDQAPLPPAETAYIGGAPEVRVPTIADRLYSRPPADSGAGPIPLVLPAD